MSLPIAVFYHCAPFLNGNFSPFSYAIILSQMNTLRRSGLDRHSTEITIGVSSCGESAKLLRPLIPPKARQVIHGAKCSNENRSIEQIERWVRDHKDWYVLYFHSKGASRSPGDKLAREWRECMMRHLVENWRSCVQDLDSGFEAVGCHWIRGLDDSQHYFAGNCWWAKSSYLSQLPTIHHRPAIRKYGLNSASSRYEAEVWIGNGQRLPKVMDYHTGKHW